MARCNEEVESALIALCDVYHNYAIAIDEGKRHEVAAEFRAEAERLRKQNPED